VSHEPAEVSPGEVADRPDRFPDQYARTLATDLTFPVHLLQRPQRVTILDGVHRLLKAQPEGRDRIVAKVLPYDRLDEIAHR
jgi:hypothetical protein